MNMQKLILLTLTALMMVGCDMAMDSLNVLNGTEYVVRAKKINKDNYCYSYKLVKAGDSWYDYVYKDTADFNVGDTVVITIKRVGN